MLQKNLIKSILTVFLTLIASLANGTNFEFPSEYATSVEKIAEYAKLNGNTIKDQLLIIQHWMSANMIYDFDKYRQHQASAAKVLKSDKVKKATIQETLIQKKGVCEDFALLFAAIAKQLGIEMFVVTGTSSNGGSHAWCAAVIENEAYLFDPTWASGYGNVETNEYVKEFKLQYFMVSPKNFKHIPTDPLWQFSEHPLKYEDFYKEDSAAVKETPYFNWRDTFKTYVKMDTLRKAESTLRRGLGNGTPTSDIAEELTCFAFYVTTIRMNAINEETINLMNKIESGSGRWTNDSRISTSFQNLDKSISDCEWNMLSVKSIDKIYQKEINIYLKQIEEHKKIVARYKTKLEKQKKDDDKRSLNRQKDMQLFKFSY